MIYYLNIFLTFVVYLIPDLRANKTFILLFQIYICIFLCFGYMCGSDWRSYESMYDYYSKEEISIIEPAYYSCALLCKSIGVDFWSFFIMLKIILFGLINKLLYRFSQKDYFLVLCFSLPLFLYFGFIDNPMRNLIAVTIFAFSIFSIQSRRWWIYILLILLASLFHVSAFFMLPMYWLVNLKIKNSLYVVLFILINLLFTTSDVIAWLVEKMLPFVPFVEGKIITYFVLGHPDGQGQMFSLSLIIHFIMFFLLLKYRCKLQLFGEYSNIIFNLAIFYIFCVRLGITINILARLGLYFIPFYAIIVPRIINVFVVKVKMLYVSFILVFSCCLSLTVFRTSVYIPYTNYLEYVLRDEYPSFRIRYNYNYQNSPYKKELE